MDSNLLPGAMASVPHLKAFDDMIRERMSNIDISPCMMYMIDTCSPDALPYLADQFDIAQFRDYQLAPDDATRRALIKKAVNTRAYMGTVWIIKQAFIAVGFDPALLVERAGEGADPVHGWAQFKTTLGGGSLPVASIPSLALSDLILQYKPARCQWLGVEFSIDAFEDGVPVTGEFVNMGVHYAIEDHVNTEGLKFDGSWKLDGSKKCRPGIERFNII